MSILMTLHANEFAISSQTLDAENNLWAVKDKLE